MNENALDVIIWGALIHFENVVSIFSLLFINFMSISKFVNASASSFSLAMIRRFIYCLLINRSVLEYIRRTNRLLGGENVCHFLFPIIVINNYLKLLRLRFRCEE